MQKYQVKSYLKGKWNKQTFQIKHNTQMTCNSIPQQRGILIKQKVQQRRVGGLWVTVRQSQGGDRSTRTGTQAYPGRRYVHVHN